MTHANPGGSKKTALQAQDCWNAVLARDAGADGAFVYAVSSTGVYCKPSCASRRPRRDRVAFFESPDDARRAGYRACRRCRPDEVNASDPWIEKVRRACVYLANVDGHLSLAHLAARFPYIFDLHAAPTPGTTRPEARATPLTAGGAARIAAG